MKFDITWVREPLWWDKNLFQISIMNWTPIEFFSYQFWPFIHSFFFGPFYVGNLPNKFNRWLSLGINNWCKRSEYVSYSKCFSRTFSVDYIETFNERIGITVKFIKMECRVIIYVRFIEAILSFSEAKINYFHVHWSTFHGPAKAREQHPTFGKKVYFLCILNGKHVRCTWRANLWSTWSFSFATCMSRLHRQLVSEQLNVVRKIRDSWIL